MSLRKRETTTMPRAFVRNDSLVPGVAVKIRPCSKSTKWHGHIGRIDAKEGYVLCVKFAGGKVRKFPSTDLEIIEEEKPEQEAIAV